MIKVETFSRPCINAIINLKGKEVKDGFQDGRIIISIRADQSLRDPLPSGTCLGQLQVQMYNNAHHPLLILNFNQGGNHSIIKDFARLHLKCRNTDRIYLIFVSQFEKELLLFIVDK